MSVDYRRLNEVSQKDSFPSPRPPQAVDALAGAKVLSSLDLAMVYSQVPVARRDLEKTTLRNNGGF